MSGIPLSGIGSPLPCDQGWHIFDTLLLSCIHAPGDVSPGRIPSTMATRALETQSEHLSVDSESGGVQKSKLGLERALHPRLPRHRG